MGIVMGLLQCNNYCMHVLLVRKKGRFTCLSHKTFIQVSVLVRRIGSCYLMPLDRIVKARRDNIEITPPEMAII